MSTVTRPLPSWTCSKASPRRSSTRCEASPYANDTAIFITFDEGGGYYDSGYVQPLDYFGDGTRIPLIVVSKYI
jgi:phospholipase C